MSFISWRCSNCERSGLAEVGTGPMAMKLAKLAITHRHNRIIARECPVPCIVTRDSYGVTRRLSDGAEVREELLA